MRRILIITALALSAVTLVGCTATSGQTSSPSSGMEKGQPAPDTGGAPAPVQDAAGGAKGVITVPTDRQVITTGHLALTVKNPGEAADDATRIVEQAGGRVDDRTERPPVKDEAGSAQLTVRIPSAALTATLESLKKLGTLQDNSLNSQDVTAQAQDLGARVSALRTSVDRLIALMAKANNTADLIAIESALSERQANLESLEAQKRSLDSQVELATITLDLRAAADAPPETPDTFLSGLITGWNAFVGFFAGVVVVLGVLVPWIALAAVLAGIALYFARAKRRAGKASID